MLLRKSLVVSVVCSLALSIGCSDDTDSNQTNNQANSNSSITNINQDPGDDKNACGGDESLIFDGAIAQPGASCGECGGGILECDGDNALVCNDDGSLNACGGCELLEGSPGGECGNSGEWVCTVNGNVFCNEGELPGVVIVAPDTQDPDTTFEVGTNTAVFKASVDELPITAAISDHGFCWSETPGPTLQTAECESLGPVEAVGEFRMEVTNLLPGRHYYIVSYAQVSVPTALTDGAVYYSEETVIATKAKNPEGLANSGDMHTDYVALSWDAIEGATEYVVYRDGEEVGRTTTPSFEDTTATAPPVPGIVATVQAEGYTNRVVLRWDEAVVEDGPVHTYQVQVVYPTQESELSPTIEAYRAAAPVEAYELSINGGDFESIGAELSHEDFNAPANVINVPTIRATQGENSAHVELSIIDAPETSSISVEYVIRAVNATGAGEASNEVMASRTIGELEYQWEQAIQNNDLSFSALIDAIGETHNDTTAPANGAERYYRLAVSAQGAQTVYSDAVVGYRAATASLSTLAASDVAMNQAVLNGSLSAVGVPAASAHGFCYGTSDNPSLRGDATCVDLGAANAIGNFDTMATGLSAGTEYFVRAFATTVAGTTYGTAQKFWTITVPPTVSTSARGNTITINWSPVLGAVSYKILRDGAVLGEVNAPTQSYTDTSAILPPPPGPAMITSISDATRTDGVLIQWDEASVSPGALHTYEVVAINRDGLASDASAVDGQLQARPIRDYEIKIGDGEWQAVDTTHGMQYLDEDAPLGEITVGPITAGQGSTREFVSLESSVLIVSDPPIQSYAIRAVSAAGNGPTDSGEGRRDLSPDNYFQWFSSDDSEGVFAPLFAPSTMTDANYQDSAPPKGEDHYYYVEISAAGAQTFTSDIISGYRALEAQVSTQSATAIEMTTAQLHGTLVDVGRPTPIEHGFCYGTLPNPTHDNSEQCTQLGAISDEGEFVDSITGLTAGTLYYVQSYATNNADTVYGNEISFWTRPEAPTGLSASSDAHEKVTISWNAVTGAANYLVYRDGMEIADLNVQSLGLDATQYDDVDADAAPVPDAPEITHITEGDRHDGVIIEWEEASVDDGTIHDYHVVAVNPDLLESQASSTIQGNRAAREITGYQLKIGTNSFNDINTTNGLEYLDDTAPKAQLTLGTTSASHGTTKAHVLLSSSVAHVENPATQTYELRALNGAGIGESASTSGYRSASVDYAYQWYYSETGEVDTFSSLFDPPNTTSNTYEDSTAPINGSERYYFVRVTADGVDTIDSDVVDGYKAVDAVVSTQVASNITIEGATLHGTLVETGKPTPTEHGFCYGTTPLPAHNDSEVICTQLGARSQAGSFDEIVTDLEDGTLYYVRSYAINNASTVYGEEQTFWTTPNAPTSVNTTSQVHAVEISWSVTQGANVYRIYRKGPDDISPVLVDTVSAPTTTYVDDNVEGGLPDKVALTTPSSQHPEHIRLDWSAPQVADGANYDYSVTAVNADGLESESSEISSSAPQGAAIGSYELQINDGSWTNIGNVLFYEDQDASAGEIVPGTITVGNAESVSEISLSATAPDISDGTSRSYRVRAVHKDGANADRSGEESDSVSSHRVVENVVYQWQRKGSGDPDSAFSAVALGCASSLICDDTTADLGESYSYRLMVSADGASSVYTTVEPGSLATLKLAFATYPSSEITAGTDFSVSLRVETQLGDPFAADNVPVTLTLNQNKFADDSTYVSGHTDSSGVITFNNLNIEIAASGYELVPTTDDIRLDNDETPSDEFSILADSPVAANSTISGQSGKGADGQDSAAITITLKDDYENPVPDITPEFSATGSANTLGSCSATNSNGVSTCSLATTIAEDKELSIISPFNKVGDTISFVFVCHGSEFQFGDGSSEPYSVCNAAQLNAIGLDSNLWDKKFVLLNDIDMDNEDFTMFGSPSTAFVGSFDGDDHTISNLTIDEQSTQYVGMFRVIDTGAEIKNLTLTDVYVQGSHQTGALVGRSYDGDITNIHISGYVEGASHTGGMVGENNATITDSSSRVNVVGSTEYVGGLAGYNTADITRSAVRGTVYNSGNFTGGLVGAMTVGTISQSFATGAVEATGNHIGGLIGQLDGGSSEISDSYAHGDVAGNNDVGGLIGWHNDGTVMNSYASGNIEGTGAAIGYLIGDKLAETPLSNAYYHSGVVCYASSPCETTGSGIDSGSFGSKNDYETVFSGFDFHDTWGISGCDGPVLQWQQLPPVDNCVCDPSDTDLTKGPGLGTADKPYQICSAEQLDALSDNHYLNSHLILVSDINMSGKSPYAIGNHVSKFTGTFDGQGHTISNFYISRTSYSGVAFISYVAAGGEVKNIRFTAMTVFGGAWNTGSVVAVNEGLVSNIGISGSQVSGSHYVGGLVGHNIGTIETSATNISVNASTQTAGGIAGINDGVIRNSYARGNIGGSVYFLGGLVGQHNSGASIINSYATGNISAGTHVGSGYLVGRANGSIENSYYSTDSSFNCGTSPCVDAGEGLSLFDMQVEGNFTNWLFSPASGYHWVMPGGAPPKLYWE